MKNYLLYFLLTVLIANFSSCSEDENLITPDLDTKWWLLVHPSYGNSGIYLYNETDSAIEKRINLPYTEGSPHALDFDGDYLWIGGMGDDNFIYKIDPNSGEVLSRINNINTEGIACSEEYLYYTNYSTITKIKKDGTFVEEFPLTNSQTNLQDLAISDSKLYGVCNAEVDPIVILDPSLETRISC